jgi:YVTN family beta-propeller protein
VKRFIFLPWCIALCFGCAAQRGVSDRKSLPNGWTLTPAGNTLELGSDLPLNMASNSDGSFIAITNNGVSTQTLQLVRGSEQRITYTKEIPKAWLGLKFSKDDRYLYAAGGNDNRILKYAVQFDTLVLVDTLALGDKWPANKICPTGIEIDDGAGLLYAGTKEDSSLYIIDLVTKKIVRKVPLGAEAYTCVLSPDRRSLYISLWGSGKLAVFDTHNQVMDKTIDVGRNPNDIAITKNGKYVFVANSVDNTVSVIGTRKNEVIETLNAALYVNAPSGSTPNSVALSDDDNTLYIANADNNCLAVYDVSNPGASFSKGYIPTGWYPTCVRVVNHRIWVLNGKGNTSLPNPKGPQPVRKDDQTAYKKADKRNEQYIGGLFKGTANIIPEPTETQLANFSHQVYNNTPYTKAKDTIAEGEPGNSIPMRVGDTTPIKHVFYIIKENRTYDQVLGDEPLGNGDTSLVLFGKRVSPNEHALAEQFVLLDNFYVDAEVSADGHNWSMAAYANDFVEKTWPTNYGGRGGNYDFAANKKVAEPKNGFIWDYALRAGLSVRDYGEFTDDDGNTYLPDLKKHMCPKYPGWNLGIKDTTREKIWERDFDVLLSLGSVPQLNIIYFPNDHTAGLKKDSRSPSAYVADNDMAIGMFLEHLSHSPVWADCAVFILEDDAQNGPDHVDAHRSIAFVAGPYVKHNYVDHTMYSTSGMLRTMELILGLPPMSQYDAAAEPMYRCFTATPALAPYKAQKEQVDLDEKNVAVNRFSPAYQHMDLSDADRVPDKLLNEAIWKSVKGDAPYPQARRAAFVKVRDERKEKE